MNILKRIECFGCFQIFYTFWEILRVLRYFERFQIFYAFWDILRVLRFFERLSLFRKKKLAMKSISSVCGYVKPFVLKSMDILNVQNSI